MVDDIEMRMKEAQDEAILDFQQSRSQRVNTSAVADDTLRNIAVITADPMTRKPENQFARDLYKHKKDTPSHIISYSEENRIINNGICST
jgi:urate oxidase